MTEPEKRTRRTQERLRALLHGLAEVAVRLGTQNPGRILSELETLPGYEDIGYEDIKDVRDVRWLLKRARDRGNLTLTVEPLPPNASEDTELSERLMRETNLQHAVVVNTTVGYDEGYDSADDDARETAWAAADALHEQVGAFAARHLWDRLRNHDLIAIGGGRGAGYAAYRLGDMNTSTSRRFDNLRLLSLTGRYVVRPWTQPGVNLDANEVVIRLQGMLEVDPMNIKVVDLSFAPSDEFLQNAPSEPQHQHIWAEDWDEVPDVALLGVGVLNTSHHLLRFYPGQSEHIIEDLRTLRVDVLPNHLDAIAEICGQLFWIGGEHAFEPDVMARAKTIIRQINQRVISVPLTKLDRIKCKILVAAGAQKYPAVRALLLAPDAVGMSVNTLVTDTVTAESILNELA